MTPEEILLNIILWLPALMSIPTYYAGRYKTSFSKWTAVGTISVTTVLSFILWFRDFTFGLPSYDGSGFLYVTNVNWFTAGNLTINYHLGVDGLSMPLVMLSQVVFLVTVFSSFYIHDKEDIYYALYLFLFTGLIGTFISLDLFLFYIFWEIVLVPMFFIIIMWGGENRRYAAFKFFIYTNLASLVMLIGLILMYHFGNNTFDMVSLKANLLSNFNAGKISVNELSLIFWLVFIGFIVKFPQVPFHTWLPDAHVQAPSPGSSILAGLLLKMGGYGLIRIGFWLIADTGFFTTSIGDTSRIIMGVIGAVSMIYPAFIALRQTDLKKMIAYSSISHMGIVLLGLAAFNSLGLNAALFMMIAHGLISPGLFLVAGIVEHHTKNHTRNMDIVGGLGHKLPFLTALYVFLTFASAGLPGLAGFVAEFLGFSSLFTSQLFIQPSWVWIPIIALLSIIVTASYYLWAVRRVAFGTVTEELENAEDAKWWESGPVFVLALLALLFGVLPGIIQKIFDQWVKLNFFP